MNKDWVHLNKNTTAYKVAVHQFAEIAKSTAEDPNWIICPCKDCQNLYRGNEDMLVLHLLKHGMDMTYTNWIWHGEGLNAKSSSKESVLPDRIIEDAYVDNEDIHESNGKEGEDDLTNMLKDANIPLYHGCTKYSRLSAIIILYKHKSMYGVSNKCVNHLLEILHDMLPDENTIPESTRAAQQLIKSFKLDCEIIHACINDCCLFRGEFKVDDVCRKCHGSRWKKDTRTKEILIGVLVKILRYFPIIPRFRRMFQTSELAENLRWHHNHKSEDDKIRHPVDSLVWKTIDNKWPSFAAELRNLRLGLAADGFNPFRGLSSSHSCWPVMLVIYNLPPGLCMRKEHIMLSLLISGPQQLENDIDIYLQPLIDDLQVLFDVGVQAYDAFTKTFFNLKAILMWTINDFPAYGNLARCTTKGKLACPICGTNTYSKWLKHSKKTVYLNHRRFLGPKHTLRFKRSWFDGKQELEEPPRLMVGSRILNEIKNIENDFGKGFKKNSCNLY